MNNAFRLFFLGSLSMLLTSNVSLADHGDEAKSKGRSEDNVRIVRQNGETVVKEITKDGIQSTFIDKDGKSYTKAWSFSDFTSEKVSCTDEKGQLVAGALKDKVQDVINAGKAEGFKIKLRDDDFAVFEYDCNKVTLKQIQNLYFNSSVRYVEPDAKVSIQ
ncbi:MAG: hypothetical protein EXR74_02235 [Bdellovibrionales bacterium]|nr:hypothetical protein [Bdellovibrionales bacterium]